MTRTASTSSSPTPPSSTTARRIRSPSADETTRRSVGDGDAAGRGLIHGRNGAFFHSDVRVFNPSLTQSATVKAEYRCFTGACDRVARTFTVAPREMKVFDDVVAALFAAPESAGPIEFTGDLVFVESRVYTPERTLPTTGSHVRASSGQARLKSVLTSLAHSALLSAGFRTNVGFYNPGPAEESALVTLHLPDGAEVGRLPRRSDGGARPR